MGKELGYRGKKYGLPLRVRRAKSNAVLGPECMAQTKKVGDTSSL
jgi:hypothetical protein